MGFTHFTTQNNQNKFTYPCLASPHENLELRDDVIGLWSVLALRNGLDY